MTAKDSSAGRPLWAALGGPGYAYAYDDRLETLWRAGQRAARGTVVQLRLFEFEEEKS